MNAENAYTIVYDWMRQLLGNTLSCSIFALLYSFKDENNSVSMSHGYMARRLCCDEQAVMYHLRKLQEMGCVIKASVGGNGRKDTTTYTLNTKGYENLYSKNEKGMNFNTLKTQKGYEKSYSKRVLNFTPNNNLLLNNAIAQTRAREDMNDYNFIEFWTLFAPADEFQDRRRACCQAWAELLQPQRDQMLSELRRGEPHRQNPLFYIRYFGEDRVAPDAPKLLKMQEVYKQYNTTEPKGWCILDMEFEGTDKARWCKIEDAERCGYPIRRRFA